MGLTATGVIATSSYATRLSVASTPRPDADAVLGRQSNPESRRDRPMDQHTGLMIVFVAFLAVALVVLAQKSRKLQFKLWGAEAGLQSDAPENLITGDSKKRR